MEQRVDPKDIPLEYAAGTDPAYIPGLTAPRSAGTRDVEEAEEPVPEPTEERRSDTTVPEDAPPPGEEDAVSDTGEEASGPVFEVSDRRGSVRADRDGVRFRLDEEEAEFRWDEIGAVETKSGRLGRRFTVTVHLTTRRWFNAEVEAPARSLLKEWVVELDAVLDAYFEES
ncbi:MULTISPECIES: hypothetical protein [unclassified Streptomyces]|uniref:hypothetical protein n=1 Tax=unclassified Streptomyces TaxID=2593676 RepID=UPI002DD97644|nr:hypothetical protein [Streptomyces sp. NBC_01750]WSA98353.1 hypothetical protein OIE54_03255 [Streptomyces sp. NBC_01794]WSD37109.1 hypothetical protein OG966_37525 [Streptomyces sp. NBC_01750]